MAEKVKGMSLNKASYEDLLRVPEFGPRRAQQIVEWRDEHGPFKSWDDVDAIPGFTPTMVDALKREGLTLD